MGKNISLSLAVTVLPRPPRGRGPPPRAADGSPSLTWVLSGAPPGPPPARRAAWPPSAITARTRGHRVRGARRGGGTAGPHGRSWQGPPQLIAAPHHKAGQTAGLGPPRASVSPAVRGGCWWGRWLCGDGEEGWGLRAVATSVSPGLCPQGGRFPSPAQGSWLWGPRDMGGDIGQGWVPPRERNQLRRGSTRPRDVTHGHPGSNPHSPARGDSPRAPPGSVGDSRAGPWLDPGHRPPPATWPRGPTPRPGHGASVRPLGMGASSEYPPPASALTR